MLRREGGYGNGKVLGKNPASRLVQEKGGLVRGGGSLKEGKNAIPEWIFANRFGSFIDIKNVKTRNFKRVLKKAQLRSIRFHDLRHHASQLLSNGTNVLYVSQQLGHANPGITMKIYAKWIPNKGQCEAMNSLPSLSRQDHSQAEKVAV